MNKYFCYISGIIEARWQSKSWRSQKFKIKTTWSA